MDRVTDLLAERAAPAALRVRDSLLVALSFSTGAYEAICFLTFGKVFTAFQTGNFIFLGLGVAGIRPPAGPNSVTVVISLAAFAAGAAAAMLVLRAFDGDQETEDGKVTQAWPRRVTATLAFALILQVGFVVVWVTTAAPAHQAYVLIALEAFAMGLQMNAVRSLHVPGVSTTAFTATFIDLVSDLAARSRFGASPRRLVAALLSTVAGAILGAWMLSHALAYSPVVPSAVMTAVIITASVSPALARDERKGESDAGTGAHQGAGAG